MSYLTVVSGVDPADDRIAVAGRRREGERVRQTSAAVISGCTLEELMLMTLAG